MASVLGRRGYQIQCYRISTELAIAAGWDVCPRDSNSDSRRPLGPVLLVGSHQLCGCASSSVATVDLPAAAPSLANFFMDCCGATAIQRSKNNKVKNSPNSPPPGGHAARLHPQSDYCQPLCRQTYYSHASPYPTTGIAEPSAHCPAHPRAPHPHVTPGPSRGFSLLGAGWGSVTCLLVTTAI